MRYLRIALGILLVVVGSIAMLSPIPGPTLVIAAGLGLLICNSNRVASYIQATRAARKWINKPMIWMENNLGERLTGPLRRTRPVLLDARCCEDHCA